MGNLGFLTDADVIHAEDALLAMKEKRHFIEKRMMLKGMAVVRDKKEQLSLFLPLMISV